MNICMIHGYLLTGTGSNIYVQNMAREFCRLGNNVYVICQEGNPQSLDFISEVFVANNRTHELDRIFQQDISNVFQGRCSVIIPDLEGILPVYVYDHYPDFQVKEFHLMSADEIDDYADKNAWVIKKVINDYRIEFIMSNHTILQPYEAYVSRKSNKSRTDHIAVAHGSALNFSVKRSGVLVPYAVKGINDADKAVVVSQHARDELWDFFHSHIENIEDKTRVIPAGVDIEMFRPVSSNDDKLKLLNKISEEIPSKVRGGRNTDQVSTFLNAVRTRSSLEQIPDIIQKTKQQYNQWSPDSDIVEKLATIQGQPEGLVVYFGKYLATKGIQLLIAAAPLVLRSHPQARFLAVGFGEFREVLELMVHALQEGDTELFETIAFDTQQVLQQAGTKELKYLGQFIHTLRENGEYQDYLIYAQKANLNRQFVFTGYLDHSSLSKLLPCCDISVAPSIFPEAFGMVAVEALSSGVMPIPTHHSGFVDVIRVIDGHFRDDFKGLQQLDLNMDLVNNLANNINVFLDHFAGISRSERNSIRQRCAKLAADNFTWSAVAKRLLDSYSSI